MSDIVERLRQQATIEAKKFGDSADIQLEWKAAAEITRLRARVEELSDLVGYLAGRNNDHIRVMLAGNPDVCDRLIDRARAALEAKP